MTKINQSTTEVKNQTINHKNEYQKLNNVPVLYVTHGSYHLVHHKFTITKIILGITNYEWPESFFESQVKNGHNLIARSSNPQ
jgi:hypothetical protein